MNLVSYSFMEIVCVYGYSLSVYIPAVVSFSSQCFSVLFKNSNVCCKNCLCFSLIFSLRLFANFLSFPTQGSVDFPVRVAAVALHRGGALPFRLCPDHHLLARRPRRQAQSDRGGYVGHCGAQRPARRRLQSKRSRFPYSLTSS